MGDSSYYLKLKDSEIMPLLKDLSNEELGFYIRSKAEYQFDNIAPDYDRIEDRTMRTIIRQAVANTDALRKAREYGKQGGFRMHKQHSGNAETGATRQSEEKRQHTEFATSQKAQSFKCTKKQFEYLLKKLYDEDQDLYHENSPNPASIEVAQFFDNLKGDGWMVCGERITSENDLYVLLKVRFADYSFGEGAVLYRKFFAPIFGAFHGLRDNGHESYIDAVAEKFDSAYEHDYSSKDAYWDIGTIEYEMPSDAIDAAIRFVTDNKGITTTREEWEAYKQLTTNANN